MAVRHLILAGIIGMGLPAAPLWSWGFQVHRFINGAAVDVLPGPLGAYFQQERRWLVALSTAPDQRREFDRSEEPNHYIDFEYFGDPPYRDIPHDRRAAEEKYGAENLVKWGLLPWRMLAMTEALRQAMEDGQWERAVMLAANLGHYVADAHQPLHTTVNYDGKQSGNDGIHHMFETAMLDPHLDDLAPPKGRPAPIQDLPETVFGWLRESFSHVDTLLQADSTARSRLTAAQKAVVAQGFSTDRETVPKKYLTQLYRRTGPMARDRISLATTRVAALWLWAWEAAGKPTPPQ